MYVKVNVVKPGNVGGGGDKKDKITLIDVDDVSTMPARDGSEIVITGDIVMKAGTYMIQMYGTQDTIKANSDSEGESDAKGIMQTVEFSHPGDSQAIREFRAYWMNRNIMAIIERCSSTKKNLYGTPCAPLQMVFKAEDDKDKNKTTFTFKSVQKGPDVADYQGTTTLSAVTGTVAANATSVTLTASGRYQLTTGTSAIATLTTCTGMSEGMVFTLIGSGGTYPSAISAANDFLLSGGTAWSGIAGAEITFKAFQSGASAWKFIELSRK